MLNTEKRKRGRDIDGRIKAQGEVWGKKAGPVLPKAEDKQTVFGV